MSSDEIDADFEVLLQYLKETRGFDFTGYKRPSLMRRIAKRMQAVEIDSYAAYRDHLEVQPDEFGALFDTILVNLTGFYRDPAAWDHLRDEVLPRLLADKDGGAPIRAWSAGCASGEEAYTLAMLLADALGPEGYPQRVKIYATDVDEDALTTARHGSYAADAVEALPAAWLERYFEAEGERYVVRGEIRRGVIFGRLDLVQDAPISRLDLLVCRNTLMYLNAETQTRVLARFHFSLNDEGLLFLGRAEMLLSQTALFTPVSLKHRIFRKSAEAGARNRAATLVQAAYPDAANNLVARNVRLRDRAFDVSPSAQIVVDLNDRLVMANNQARAVFGLTPADIGRPFRELELSYRPVELRAPIQQAYAQRRPVTMQRVERVLAGGTPRYLDVRVSPLLDNGGTLLGVDVAFADRTDYYGLEDEHRRSTQELETTQEELQSSNEELETTNEELQSANEELETTNEELQSSNEELETTNEELRSSNEQLQAINLELRARTQELSDFNAYLRAILFSLRAGAVALDRDLKVRLWSGVTAELWGLREDEVRDRPLLELDIGLPLAELERPLRKVIGGESGYEERVLDAVDRRGRKLRCRVTCMPVLSADDHIQGVLLLMERTERSPA